MTCAWLHPLIIGELLFRCWQAVTRHHFIACPFLLLLLPRHCVGGFLPKKCTCMHNDAGISSMFLTCTCDKPVARSALIHQLPFKIYPSKFIFSSLSPLARPLCRQRASAGLTRRSARLHRESRQTATQGVCAECVSNSRT